jgi:hypothetical protein
LTFRQDRQPFDHGDNKRGCLPRPSLRAPDDVSAFKGGRNGLSLNGSGNQ